MVYFLSVRETIKMCINLEMEHKGPDELGRHGLFYFPNNNGSDKIKENEK